MNQHTALQASYMLLMRSSNHVPLWPLHDKAHSQSSKASKQSSLIKACPSLYEDIHFKLARQFCHHVSTTIVGSIYLDT